MNNSGLLDNLIIDDSFDKHYKLIQSLRNQYLTMVRMILKNKRLNNLTLEEILGYHDIEHKILELRKDISTLINNKYINLTQPDNSDIKMFRTLNTFLPLMLIYYNTLSKETEIVKGQSQEHIVLNTLDIPID